MSAELKFLNILQKLDDPRSTRNRIGCRRLDGLLALNLPQQLQPSNVGSLLEISL